MLRKIGRDRARHLEVGSHFKFDGTMFRITAINTNDDLDLTYIYAQTTKKRPYRPITITVPASFYIKHWLPR